MTRRLGSVAVTALWLTSALNAEQTQSWVSAKFIGEARERAAWVPQTEPYDGAPSIRLPLRPGESCGLTSGETCAGFELAGWREAEGVRVVVRALVAIEPNVEFGDWQGFQKRQVATALLRPGAPVVLTQLRALGVTPIELTTTER